MRRRCVAREKRSSWPVPSEPLWVLGSSPTKLCSMLRSKGERMRLRPLLLALTFSLGLLGPTPALGPASAEAAESWQYHLAQANNFNRNRLYPKALEELRLVVADTEGAKQIKAWQLIVSIASRMKDLETLIWALEEGVKVAEGQEARSMQAQRYRLKRVYGRALFKLEGGSGKLPSRGLELELKSEISDPEVLSYFERGAIFMKQDGYSLGSLWLPQGEYELDGAPLKIVAGKDTVIEVAPTTDVTLGIEMAGLGGARAGEATTGNAGGLGGLQVLVGPHIRFASGMSLLIQGGGMALLGAQSTVDVQQDAFENHSVGKVSAGGIFLVGLEFRVGNVDLAPRVGYAAQYLAPGIYYSGTVSSSPEGHPSSVLRGDFIVPAVAHGPRFGLQALLGKSVNERGKRVARVFVGIHGGPLWATPQWGDLAEGATVASSTGTPRDADPGGQLSALGQGADGLFTFGSTSLDESNRQKPVVFVDVQAVVGLQFRL